MLPSADRGSYWIPLVRELASRTEATAVFTADPGPLAPETDRTGGIDVRVVGRGRYIGRGDGADYGRGLRLLSPALIPQLRRMRPDVVVTMAFSLWTVMIALGASLGWWRMAILYDGSSPAVDYRDSPARTRLRRWLIRAAHVSISNSDAGRRYLADHLGAGHRAVALPFMVADTRALGGDELPPARSDLQERVLLAVGALERRKGVHLLLDALAARDVPEDPPWRLLVVGEGPERNHLESQAVALELADRVTFTGQVDHDQLGRYFLEADAFVFPSLADTWGVVVLEAMAFGKAVVGSTSAGASELVEDGVTGFVIDPRDPDALSAAIFAAVSDLDACRRMGSAAREAIAAHTPAAAAERVLRALAADAVGPTP